MPTTVVTYSPSGILQPLANPQDARTIRVLFAASATTFAKGTVIGLVTATGRYKAYASASVDGSEIPVAITDREYTVDGTGAITNTDDNGSTWEAGGVAYVAGEFDSSQLTGIDANCKGKLCKLVRGTIAAGHIILL